MVVSKKKSRWESVKEIMTKHNLLFGAHISYQLANSPRRVLYSLSYYKFAAKIIGPGKRVLDVGCGEGIGTWLLRRECGHAKGIDMDKDALSIAKKNWQDPGISFVNSDFLSMKKGQFDAVVVFDVIEHILAKDMSHFFQKLLELLTPNGVVIVGTPNITSSRYASDIAKAGHVNMHSGDRLEKWMAQHFHHVFMFGANDEVVHTGFLPMAHYLIAVACRKRR